MIKHRKNSDLLLQFFVVEETELKFNFFSYFHLITFVSVPTCSKVAVDKHESAQDCRKRTTDNYRVAVFNFNKFCAIKKDVPYLN